MSITKKTILATCNIRLTLHGQTVPKKWQRKWHKSKSHFLKTLRFLGFARLLVSLIGNLLSQPEASPFAGAFAAASASS